MIDFFDSFDSFDLGMTPEEELEEDYFLLIEEIENYDDSLFE